MRILKPSHTPTPSINLSVSVDVLAQSQVQNAMTAPSRSRSPPKRHRRPHTQLIDLLVDAFGALDLAQPRQRLQVARQLENERAFHRAFYGHERMVDAVCERLNPQHRQWIKRASHRKGRLQICGVKYSDYIDQFCAVPLRVTFRTNQITSVSQKKNTGNNGLKHKRPFGRDITLLI